MNSTQKEWLLILLLFNFKNGLVFKVFRIESTIVRKSALALFHGDYYFGISSIACVPSFAGNGDYTTRLNYQVSCAYKPNGSGTTRTAYVKNMGWHFARYGGVAHADEPLYCIEPWRNYAASTSGNSVDRDVTLNGSSSTTGSNVWYSLPSARREAIGLILLYSNQQWNHSVSVTTTKKDSNPNVPLRVATQILIYEIVCGLRDPNSFKRNSTNECGTSGDVFYNAASASVSGFSSCYNSLVSAIQSAKKIPSFCGSSSSNAPTIQLSGDTGSAYDSNGVLSAFSFSNGNGARFSKSGNTLNITKTGDISESTVFTATRYLPSASNSSYNIWYMSGSSYRTTISLYNAGSSGLNAYFKIKAPSLGNISLTKTTEDGKNLSGWFPGASATWYPPWMPPGMIPVSENGILRTCLFCRNPSVMCWLPARRPPLKISVSLCTAPMWTPSSTPVMRDGRGSLFSGWSMK